MTRARPVRFASRTVLAGLLAFAGSALPALAPRNALSPQKASAAPETPRCEHVVLVILGGGVASADALGRKDLCPTLRAIADAGTASDGWACAARDHEDAVQGILTGRDVPPETPGRRRPRFPTVLECARKGLGLAPRAVWYCSYVGDEALEVACSDHEGYGEAFSPAITAGEGPLADGLRPLLARFGRPNPTPDATWTWLERLRAATAAEAGTRLAPPVGPSAPGVPSAPSASNVAPAEATRVERAVLEEIDRRTSDLRGAAALDARALRAATTVLALYRPPLVVVRLGQADVGHADLFAYWDVLKRDDAEIGRLRARIASDAALRGRTVTMVVSELGRNAGLNASGGRDHDDGTASATTVAFFAEGPGVARGSSPRAGHSVRDVAPTIARLLGFPMPFAQGAAREELLAR